MKKLIALFCFLLILSCSSDEQKPQEIDLSNLKISIDLGDDFFTTTFDLNKYDKQDIINQVIEEMANYKFDDANKSSNTQSYIGADLIFSDNTLIVIPIEGVEPVQVNGDDKKCGGEPGEGWTSYGTCGLFGGEECVTGLVIAASNAESPNLSPGKCLDIRIKRNVVNARVCARLIDC